MKYYYNGQKVRTSDNVYTHGILYNGKVIACCGSKALAEKRLSQEINYRNEQMRQCESNPEYLQILKNRFETLKIIELEVK